MARVEFLQAVYSQLDWSLAAFGSFNKYKNSLPPSTIDREAVAKRSSRVISLSTTSLGKTKNNVPMDHGPHPTLLLRDKFQLNLEYFDNTVISIFSTIVVI